MRKNYAYEAPFPLYCVKTSARCGGVVVCGGGGGAEKTGVGNGLVVLRWDGEHNCIPANNRLKGKEKLVWEFGGFEDYIGTVDMCERGKEDEGRLALVFNVGAKVASAELSWDGKEMRLDVKKTVEVLDVTVHEGEKFADYEIEIKSIAFTADGKDVVVGSTLGDVMLLDGESLEVKRRFVRVVEEGPRKLVPASRIVCTEKFVGVNFRDIATVCVWKMDANGETVKPFKVYEAASFPLPVIKPKNARRLCTRDFFFVEEDGAEEKEEEEPNLAIGCYYENGNEPWVISTKTGKMTRVGGCRSYTSMQIDKTQQRVVLTSTTGDVQTGLVVKRGPIVSLKRMHNHRGTHSFAAIDSAFSPGTQSHVVSVGIDRHCIETKVDCAQSTALVAGISTPMIVLALAIILYFFLKGN